MYKYLVGFVLLISFSGCKKLTEVEVTGLVRDAASQLPLDSVHVRLYEDNDGPFMGTHLLQETTTDASGTFRFDFEYKEGPYKIFVAKPGYRYSRIESDNILNLSATFEYQEIAPLENKQDFIFDMAPQSYLTIKVKNVAPASPSDQIEIGVGVGQGINNQPSFIRTYEGVVDLEVPVGNFDGNTFIPINVKIRENNVWRSFNDSVFIQPHKSLNYNLNY